MQNRWRIALLWSLVAIFAIWMGWWASRDFPLEEQICGGDKAANDCASYNIVLYSAWRLAEATDHWSALITAFATAFIAWFTWTLWRTSEKQGSIAQKSIDLARAEYISSHYPRIVLRDVHLIAETVHYTLVNIGGTAATVVESWIFAEFVEENTRLTPLFPDEHYCLGQITFTGGESKNLKYELPSGISFAIKWPEARRIGIDGRPPIFGQRYFVGILTYTDDLGIKRRSIFRRRWDDASLTFVRLTPEQERDHEYAD